MNGHLVHGVHGCRSAERISPSCVRIAKRGVNLLFSSDERSHFPSSSTTHCSLILSNMADRDSSSSSKASGKRSRSAVGAGGRERVSGVKGERRKERLA